MGNIQISGGGLFHNLGVTTEKARSPQVDYKCFLSFRSLNFGLILEPAMSKVLKSTNVKKKNHINLYQLKARNVKFGH